MKLNLEVKFLGSHSKGPCILKKSNMKMGYDFDPRQQDTF